MRETFFPTPYVGEFGSSIFIEELMYERSTTKSTYAVFCYFVCPNGKKTVAECAAGLKPVKVLQLTGTETAIVEFENKNYIQITASEKEKCLYSAKLVGDLDWIIAFREKYEYHNEFKAVIDWSYMSSGNIYSKEFEIDEPLPLCDEYYPYIADGVDAYFDKYFASTASILILIGEPGTGKTSLIRYLLWKRKLHATLTFDERVMAEESYFVNYASNEKHDLMIVEDADLILSSRQSDQNKLMSKLLNISDGLIRLDKKKMIFSTNLSNVNKIDPALIRSGRCFDILHFRQLTFDEAIKASEKAGVTLATQKNELTLAEVFNSPRRKDDLERFKLLKTV